MNVLDWARKVRAIAQNGLLFTHDAFDRERYEKLQALTDSLVADELGLPVEEVKSLWKYDPGYVTPKVDVRGAVFKDEGILLVRERSDGRWSLPGGGSTSTTPLPRPSHGRSTRRAVSVPDR